jgi:hypothetical protein
MYENLLIMKRIFFLIIALLIVCEGYSQNANKYFKSGSDKLNKQDYSGASADLELLYLSGQ